MKFNKLSPQIQREIFLLTSDEEFQKRFGEDEKLDQLEELKYDPLMEYCEIQLLLHNKLKILNIELQHLTLALWAFLYAIKSPIVIDERQMTSLDVDLFFYLLQTKDFNSNMQDLLRKSHNFCLLRWDINYQEAVEIIQKFLKINFRVLNMFPRLGREKKSTFNADWITSIVTKVSQVSSYSTQQLYNSISFCEVYYLFAQYCRQKGSESIYLRTEEQIQLEIDLRSTELVVQRLIEKGVIAQKDKAYYIKQIHTVPVENNKQ